MYTQDQCKYYKGICHSYCVPNDIKQMSIQLHIGYQCCGFYLMNYDTAMYCIRDGNDVRECSFEEFMQDYSKAVMTQQEIHLRLPIKHSMQQIELSSYQHEKLDLNVHDTVESHRCKKCGGMKTSEECSNPCLPF